MQTKNTATRYSQEFRELIVCLTQADRSGKTLIKEGRTVVLKVVDFNLAAGHRITRILHVFKIPCSTYYNSLKWQPSKTEIQRKLIKEKILEYWLKFPMYGYPRLTILLNKKFQFGVGKGSIY